MADLHLRYCGRLYFIIGLVFFLLSLLESQEIGYLLAIQGGGTNRRLHLWKKKMLTKTMLNIIL